MSMHFAKNKKNIDQLSKYIFTGSLANLAALSIASFSFRFIGFSYIWSSLNGFFIGFAISFLLNNFYVFKKNKLGIVTLYKYILSFLTICSISLFLTYIFHELLGILYEIALIIAVLINTSLGFVLNKYLVFKE